MARCRRWFLALGLLLGAVTFSAALHATTDLCAVNDLTNEAYVFEEDDYIGPGWRFVGERACDDFDAFVAPGGYRMARHPYRVEMMGVAFLGGGILAMMLLRSTFKMLYRAPKRRS